MSFEEIISAVSEKPEIWLSSHPLHKNRAVTRKIWNELSVQLAIDEETLKKRWKHLKDQYRKELKKQPVLKSGSGASQFVSTWQYFDSMSFIKDDIIPSKTTGNLIESSSENDVDEALSSSINREDNNADSYVQSPQTFSDSSQCESLSTRKRSANSLREDMIELEKRKLALMEQRFHESQSTQEMNRDEDYLYLMSILPTMKKLSEIQKLRFRGKINEWLLAEMTGTVTGTDSMFPYSEHYTNI